MSDSCVFCTVRGDVESIRSEIDRLTLDRDAYKRAKQENDDRFMNDRAEALRRAEEAQDQTQKFVDSAIYYRNLAIKLGAKPEQMQDSYDRKLAADGFHDPDFWSDVIGECRENWEQLERAEQRLSEAQALIAEVWRIFGGVDHHPDDCPEDGQCIQCECARKAEALAIWEEEEK